MCTRFLDEWNEYLFLFLAIPSMVWGILKPAKVLYVMTVFYFGSKDFDATLSVQALGGCDFLGYGTPSTYLCQLTIILKSNRLYWSLGLKQMLKKAYCWRKKSQTTTWDVLKPRKQWDIYHINWWSPDFFHQPYHIYENVPRWVRWVLLPPGIQGQWDHCSGSATLCESQVVDQPTKRLMGLLVAPSGMSSWLNPVWPI